MMLVVLELIMAVVKVVTVIKEARQVAVIRAAKQMVEAQKVMAQKRHSYIKVMPLLIIFLI